MLPLSSGLDSGVIAAALKNLNIKFTIFSYYGNEKKIILIRRLLLHLFDRNKVYIKKSLRKKDFKLTNQLLNKNVSKFSYGPIQEEGKYIFDGFKDRGAHGLVFLLNFIHTKNEKIKILASGQGGDEIYSNSQDYHFGNPNPLFFDQHIEKIFPWENFYHGAQSSYLIKEESISGGFGIEGRYPLLDKNVVQEYLNLNTELKNNLYKSPITNYLIKNKYPISHGGLTDKRGFNIVKENSLHKFIRFISITKNKILNNE